MSRPKFLLDEHVPLSIAEAARRHSSLLDILHVNEQGAPSNGTPDPDILEFCWQRRRILVTDNRKSMSVHIADRIAAGRDYWGILKIKKDRRQEIGHIADTLILVWECEEAEDYFDREVWIPF